MQTNIKRTIINRLPAKMLPAVEKYSRKKHLNSLYKFDKNRHKKSAYDLTNTYTKNNLRSKITFHYHSIEKGLSNPNLRLGFGKRAFEGLFLAMDKYLEKSYPTNDKRFQQAISVIQEYLDVHENNKFETEWVSSKYAEYKKHFIDSFNNTGGAGNIKLENIPDYSELNFKELAAYRYSIRDFGEEIVSDEEIFDAIQMATKTPSVCNRQAYGVYQIKNPEILKKVYNMQGGLTTNGENLQQFLLVTCNREFMNGPHERNQTYIDGGMFLMSLVYALTYHQIASCTLNTNFTLEKEKAMRELLDVSYSEDLIAFVAIGSFAEETKYAKSPRDSYEDITVVIDQHTLKGDSIRAIYQCLSLYQGYISVYIYQKHTDDLSPQSQAAEEVKSKKVLASNGMEMNQQINQYILEILSGDFDFNEIRDQK